MEMIENVVLEWKWRIKAKARSSCSSNLVFYIVRGQPLLKTSCVRLSTSYSVWKRSRHRQTLPISTTSVMTLCNDASPSSSTGSYNSVKFCTHRRDFMKFSQTAPDVTRASSVSQDNFHSSVANINLTTTLMDETSRNSTTLGVA